MRKVRGLGRVAIACLASLAAWVSAQPSPDSVAVDGDDIGGVVMGPNGPEAGVWVIAETEDLPTKFRKIVVTDDRGRYLLPDLPAANYLLWVRGYGLVDSPRVRSAPGRVVALPAVIAPDARAAAQVYPANYWYSLIQLPSVDQFPGTGVHGNGIEAGVLTQHHWINTIKTGCNVCHQVGNLATRQFPPSLGKFESSYDAWDHRTQVGQDGTSMISAINGLGRRAALTMYADWTDRIAAGEVPPMPPRPQGIERNLVLTLWEWGGPATFAHDE
ncbi:MAG TPA: carboxypeptidase-like regulatory domain-containing protein, partial [Gammaproteobacteria bacterium]|nr:carboxypeptidase-like regulatory domain-containing protein [Gammaproteobacteria bacterium]